MENSETKQISYPPVVSVLGHVDHGKTTLLDTIRKSNVATGEAGGITQAIGASKIEITHEGKKRFITFIDTPGHEAFSNMRSHGVSASDIVLLVVAADDGIKPQTKESIDMILKSESPYIVVITKTDAPGANIEKVKQELAKAGVLLEGLGGNVPFVAVSAKTGDKIADLLDLIVIVYDFSEIKKDAKDAFSGVVIEARLDKRRGILASLIVKKGKISIGDKVFTDRKEVGKIRALVDTVGVSVKEAYPGDAVEVMGLSEVLSAGEVINTITAGHVKQETAVGTHTTADLMKILATKENEKLPVIIKTQTSGEFEAILASLPQNVEVVFEGRGEISASDVLMAKDFGAIIVGFNVKIEKQAAILAESNKTFFRTYNIIYNLLDELEDAAQLLIERASRKILGKAQILASFEGNEGKIIGARITEGRLSVGDKVVIVHGDNESPECKITSLKQGKKDIKELGKGNECGFMIDTEVDFTIGDMVLSCG